MTDQRGSQLAINIQVTDGTALPQLHAYVFSHAGELLGDAAVEKDGANVPLPAGLDGRTVEVILGPTVEQGAELVSAAVLKRAGAYSTVARVLEKQPELLIRVPGSIFPTWCICLVRGRLVKRVTLPDGTIVERPVCHARVTICEVDRIPFVLPKIPDREIFRLRDDLIEAIGPIRPPIPQPDPAPIRALHSEAAHVHSAAEIQTEAAVAQPLQLAALNRLTSAAAIRAQLASLAELLLPHLCRWPYLWPFFRKDCLSPVETDDQGRFTRVLFHPCSDQPDIYISVEQFHGGAWHTVYKPSIGCGTYWNYACGTELVINVPGAVACEDPGYDIPPGVTLFVLPYAIASTPIWGIPAGAPPAPDGWLRPDGLVNYSAPGLGMLYDAPFGSTLNFIHDDSYFIPTSGVRYYRYSFRRLSSTANTGANDPSWTPVATPLSRGYRMEYSDRLPTYEAYQVGPRTVGAQSNLFEFKPQLPPARATDPATVVVREWTSGNLSEVAASWNTLLAAPPLSDSNTSDDAGAFEVKIEVFDSSGNQVLPGAGTFEFLARNNGPTTRLATAAEVAGGAYVLRVHVDNNGSNAELPQPSVNGVSASDDCGFLRYAAGDSVHIAFTATHPNNRAVFDFGVTRGSNPLAAASTAGVYVETASASAPPYNRVAGVYQHNFAPSELVGACVNAAFAARLYVYGKATNGEDRLGYDASRLIAFALAEEEA